MADDWFYRAGRKVEPPAAPPPPLLPTTALLAMLGLSAAARESRHAGCQTRPNAAHRRLGGTPAPPALAGAGRVRAHSPRRRVRAHAGRAGGADWCRNPDH